MFKMSILSYLVTLSLYFYFGKSIDTKFTEKKYFNFVKSKFLFGSMGIYPDDLLNSNVFFKKNIRCTISVSICISLIIGWFLQNYEDKNFIKILVYGFKLPIENELYSVVKGGGIFSMGTAMVIALLSCGLVNIVDELEILKLLSEKIGVIENEWKVYFYTIVVAILTAGISCSQSTSILLTSQIMKKIYKKNKFSKETLALDIENSSVVLSSLIPWNIAIVVPGLMLDVSVVKIIPYSFYVYILPIIIMIQKIKKTESGTQLRF